MSKFLISLLLVFVTLSTTSCASNNDLINPPEWLIGYWISVNSRGINKGLEVTKNDIFIVDSPGKSISLSNHANAVTPPSFKLINSSNKDYRIRVAGDLLVFENISEEQINYDNAIYHRITPE